MNHLLLRCDIKCLFFKLYGSMGVEKSTECFLKRKEGKEGNNSGILITLPLLIKVESLYEPVALITSVLIMILKSALVR